MGKYGAFSQSRATDLFYDPLFVVSGPRDHYRQAKIAVMHNAKMTVRPLFTSMFTDLPHVPKQQVVLRTSISIPEYRSMSKPTIGGIVDIHGVDRHRFFQQPVKRLASIVPSLTIHIPTAKDRLEEKERTWKDQGDGHKVNQKVQTVYRESSAQTSPWDPDYKIVEGSPNDLEILKLGFLKWRAGLPVGMHEIKLIERARMKRQWEKSLPPVSDNASLKKRRDIIDAMEREEWAFREQEIQDIQDLRMKLLEEMLNELLANTKTRSDKKMQLFCRMKLEERAEKLQKLRRESTREKRRLDFNHRGIIMKYHPVNVVDEHADYKSELYAPMMRHGVHPKRWHQVIDDHNAKYRANYKGIEKYNTLPSWLDNGPKLDDSSIKLPGTRLCIRETKWTNPVLKQLHLELKSLREVTKRRCNLRVRVPPKEEPLPTPEVDEVDDFTENNNQGLILVQSVLRGRAAQILVFEGRDNCRELIQELRSTHGVLSKQKIEVFKEKLEVKYDQREEVFCIANSNKIQEALSRLQGTLVGTLLDFLNKELRRLLDERKAHALGIMAERERQRREAAEAGRRQYELRRRLEHDEMFKQVVKVHQDSVDMYLEDIITDGMDFASKDEAKEYVLKLAQKIDEEINEKEEILKDNILEQEELIAELVHHFVLPEVEKALVRQRIKRRQDIGLKRIHNELYETMECLPKPPPKPKRRMKRIKQESIIKAVSSEVLEEVVDYEKIEEAEEIEEAAGEMSAEDEENESFEKPQEITIFARSQSFEEPELVVDNKSSSSEVSEESMEFVTCIKYKK